MKTPTIIFILCTMLFVSASTALAQNGWHVVYRNTTWGMRLQLKFLSPTEGWAFGGFGHGDQLMHTTDGGYTWQAILRGDSMVVYHGDVYNRNRLVVVGGQHTAATTDGGQSWHYARLPNQHICTVLYLDSLTVLGLEDMVVGPPPWYCPIRRSTDGGFSWAIDTSWFNDSFQLTGPMAVSPNGTVLISFGDSFLRSTDAGRHWARVSHREYNTTEQIVSPAPHLFYVAQEYDSSVGENVHFYPAIYRSTDDGFTWQELYRNRALLDTALRDMAFPTATDGWAVGQHGLVLHTRDGGDTWEKMMLDSIPISLFSVSFADSLHGWAMSIEQYPGQWVLGYEGGTFAPRGRPEPAPQDLRITGVNPNPFNSATRLTFSLPRAGKAQVYVFDLTGRRVRTLVNRVMDAGEHSVLLDGSGLASGLYFVRAKAGTAEVTAKIVLLK